MKSSKAVVVAVFILLLSADFFAPSPSYAQSWLFRQQIVRQNQMAQQRQIQQQQQAMREQQRRQQQAIQQQRVRQQQAMRAKQQRLSQQMKQRQQAAARKRQAMAQKQRNMQLQRQKRNQKNRSTNRRIPTTTTPSSVKQKALQQHRTLRQQRLAKDRADRLKRLRLDRQKRDQKAVKANQTNNVVSLSAVASRIRSVPSKSPAATNTGKFRQSRLSQNNKPQITKQLANQRKFVQTRAKKILEAQSKLKLRNQKTNNDTSRSKQIKTQAKKQFKSCNGSSCKCSFHGDTNVLTKQGFIPIRDIVADQSIVWARDEFTGASDWKPVTNHYSNIYETMVTIELHDAVNGNLQTIKSNKLHPFFVQDELRPVSLSSIDNIDTGQWIAADALEMGDSLSTAARTSVQISKITKEIKPFKAFNLTVEGFHTYFIAEIQSTGISAVWVHNDCEDPIPKPILGHKGVQVASKTLWKDKSRLKGRIDVENPNPGQRAGQIHYQSGNEKHLYDPKTKTFPTASNKLNTDLKKNRTVQKAIHKGITKYLGET